GRTSHGVGINSSGVVTGDSGYSADGVHFSTHAFTSAGGGGLQDMGLNPGWTASFGTGINDANVVVGYGVLASGATHAFAATAPNTFTDLGTLGGANSLATGINNAGTIVGSSETSAAQGGQFHAFVYSSQGGFRDLGALPFGDGTSFGTGINASGTVVG